MDILEILNEMEEIIEESTRVPLLGKVLIDDDLIMEYVDRVRSALPDEIRQAKQIQKDRDRILSEAQNEAKNVMENTKMEIAKIAGDSEISKQAHKHAEEIYVKAKKTAQEIRSGANEYADDILSKLENNLQKALTVVQKGRDELKPKAKVEAAAGKDNVK